MAKSPARQLISLSKQILHDPVKFTVPNVSKGLKNLIEGMMNKDPANRISIQKAMCHPWMVTNRKNFAGSDVLDFDSSTPQTLNNERYQFPQIKVTCDDIFKSVNQLNLSDSENSCDRIVNEQEVDWRIKSFSKSRDIEDDCPESSTVSSIHDENDSQVHEAQLIDFSQSNSSLEKNCSEEVTFPSCLPLSGGTTDKLNRLRITYSSQQGSRRVQEDCIGLQINTGSGRTIVGIFDGHCGKESAKILQATLLQRLDIIPLHADIFEAQCKRTFKNIDRNLCEKLRESDDRSGSTAIFVIFKSNEMIVGNVGDSSAILYSSGNIVSLNELHRLSNISEYNRVTQFNDFICKERINGVLAVTRSFGDAQHKDIGKECAIDPIPEITRRHIRSIDDFMVIGSDGLFDVFKKSEIVHIVKAKLIHFGGNCSDTVDFLVKEGIRRGSCDNISAILVFMNQNEDTNKDIAIIRR